MKCPNCKSLNVFTIDSRSMKDTQKRRRSCNGCGHRFTTYEHTKQEIEQFKQSNELQRLADIGMALEKFEKETNQNWDFCISRSNIPFASFEINSIEELVKWSKEGGS